MWKFVSKKKVNEIKIKTADWYIENDANLFYTFPNKYLINILKKGH